jgi:hypothetical protein
MSRVITSYYIPSLHPLPPPLSLASLKRASNVGKISAAVITVL